MLIFKWFTSLLLIKFFLRIKMLRPAQASKHCCTSKIASRKQKMSLENLKNIFCFQDADFVSSTIVTHEEVFRKYWRNTGFQCFAIVSSFAYPGNIFWRRTLYKIYAVQADGVQYRLRHTRSTGWWCAVQAETHPKYRLRVCSTDWGIQSKGTMESDSFHGKFYVLIYHVFSMKTLDQFCHKISIKSITLHTAPYSLHTNHSGN